MLWNWFKKKPQRVYQRPQVEMSPQARAMTIKMDPKTVTDDIVKDIRRQVSELSEVPAEERKFVADQAIESVREGRNLHRLSWALVEVGVEKPEASRITRGIHNRATAMIDRNRKISLGLKKAKWVCSGAPCFVNYQGDTSGESRNKLHQKADGKVYSLKTGMKVGGDYTFPGAEWGCRCTSSVIIPGFDD